jgi:hypothetical protein
LFNTAKEVLQAPVIKRMDLSEAKEVLGAAPKESYEEMIQVLPV